MKNLLSSRLVKDSLAAHSALGLVLGMLMYLICLTGTLIVFEEQLLRWEQPEVPEFTNYDGAFAQEAMRQARTLAAADEETLRLWVPTAHAPRAFLEVGGESYWVSPEGALLDARHAPWTDMVAALHTTLHLPTTIGMGLVSAVGAMLVALIISGVLSHPRIFRDAFRLRRGGAERLQEADLHNRLSVWGLPFHLMIGITGAYFGLVGLMVAIAAPAFYAGDYDAMLHDVFGDDPVLEQPLMRGNFERALEEFRALAPEAEPIYFATQQPDTPGQYLEIAATVPGRLAYSEIWRFSSSGELLGQQGLTSGAWGGQLLYSVYRLHFGWFGGTAVLFIYALLGLALTIVSSTGINIWLARRAHENWLNHAWCGTVWGAPLALALAALATLVALPPLPVFLLAWLLAVSGCLLHRQLRANRRRQQSLTALTLLLLAFGYGWQHGPMAWSGLGLWVSLGLLATALLLAGLSSPWPRQASLSAPGSPRRRGASQRPSPRG